MLSNAFVRASSFSHIALKASCLLSHVICDTGFYLFDPDSVKKWESEKDWLGFQAYTLVEMLVMRATPLERSIP